MAAREVRNDTETKKAPQRGPLAAIVLEVLTGKLSLAEAARKHRVKDWRTRLPCTCLPSPKQPEAFAMPAQQRSGFDDQNRLSPVSQSAGSKQQPNTIAFRQLGPFDLPTQYPS